MSEQKRDHDYNVKKRTLTEFQLNDNKRRVPESTKRAMRACHLFASLLKQHFSDGICELMEENSFDHKHYTLNVLDNLLLVGGIPRDILLGTAVKDVDITFNLRELTKIHLQHLTKYHSKKEDQDRNIRCVYFQHYLNKFEPENEEENKAENEMIRFHSNPYIFNAQYFVDILECSYDLQYKLEIEDVPNHGFISCSITSDHVHEGYNLNGAKFKFTDTFDPNKVLSVQQQQQNELMERELVKSYGYDPDQVQNRDDAKKRTRWKSITLAPSGMDYAAEFDEEYKPIDIEVYGTRIKDKLLTYDFSINTAIIPLSSITEFFDGQNEDDKNMAIWFWEYIVENGITECDAIQDITVNRILRVPQPNKEKYIINIHGGAHHFWRTVELMIRLPHFYIDDNLIDAQIEHYNEWLNVEYFDDEKNRTLFINKFVNIVVNYCYDIRDLRAMLSVLDVLQFNEAFSDLLSEHSKFCTELMTAIKQRDYEELTMVIFMSYGYPFKLSQKSEESIKEIQALKEKNKRLKQQIKDLEQSKVALAMNCSKAIDQFRSVFTQ